MFIIDLKKAGKKGQQWGASKRKYIARLLMPDGSYKYITPDDDEGSFEPNKDGKSFTFKLAPGKSLAAIVNRHVWGGPTGRLSKTGKPIVADGFFRHWDVVSEKDAETIRFHAKQQGRPDPFGPTKADGSPNVVKKTTINGWLCFAVPSVKQVGQTADGKKKWGGYLDIHWTSGVKDAGYEENKELLSHKVETEDEIAAAMPQHGFIKEGEKPMLVVMPAADKKLKAATVSPSSPTLTFLNTPKTTEETQSVLGIHITEEMDPLAVAKLLKQRFKIGETATGGKKIVANFPDYMIAKYRDEEDFYDHLRERPITTMISLGLIQPTPTSTKINTRLMEEWQYDLVRGSRAGFDALKYTKLYESMKEQDRIHGLDSTDAHSFVRKLKSEVFNDYKQAMEEVLQNIARKWHGNEYLGDPKKRFDKYARTVLSNYVQARSAKEAAEEQTTLHIVAGSHVEDAANQQRQGQALSPQEGAELERLAPKALAAIERVIGGHDFPETYREVLREVLWLTDPVAEIAKIHANQEAVDFNMAEAHLKGKEPKHERRDLKDYMRKLTGKDSVLSSRAVWTDPATGEQKDLSKLSQGGAHQVIDKWFTAAASLVGLKLSVPASHGRPEGIPVGEWDNKWNHIKVTADADAADYGPVGKLAHAVLGTKGKKKVVHERVLTNEGRAVKRYLELEMKLANAARRRLTVQPASLDHTLHVVITPDKVPTIKEGPGVPKEMVGTGGWKPKETDHTTTPKAVKLKGGVTHNIKHVVVVPPSDIHHGVTGVVTQMPKAQRSTVEAINFFNASANRQLADKLGINLGALSDSSKIHGRKTPFSAGSAGVYIQPNVNSLGTAKQSVIDQAQRYYGQYISNTKASTKKLLSEQTKATAISTTLQTFGQWEKHPTQGAIWTEPKAGTGLTALHDAALAAHKARSVVEAKIAKRRAYHKDLKQTGATKEATKAKLDAFKPTSKEMMAVQKTTEKYQEHINRVASLVPEIRELYDASFGAKAPNAGTLATARAKLAAMQRDAKSKAALLQFELDRRNALAGMKKALVGANDLIAVMSDYRFALTQLSVQMRYAAW